MAQLTATFEAGANGNTITTAGGEAALSAWSTVAGSPVYSNTHVAHGTLAGRIVAGTPVSLQWNYGFQTEDYGRLYIYATANPSGAVRVIDWTAGSPSLLCDGTGHFGLFDNGGLNYMSTAMALNQWVRVEWHMNFTSGLAEIKLFNSAESTTPTETMTHPAGVPFTNKDMIRFGNQNGSNWASDYWLDDIVALATGYPGPVLTAPANTVAPVASGSPVVGQVLSVTNGTWTGTAPITYTYKWQRNGVDIGGATNNTYLLVVGDLGAMIRAVVTATNGGGAVPANSNALGPVTNPVPPAAGGQRRSRLILGDGRTIVLRGR